MIGSGFCISSVQFIQCMLHHGYHFFWWNVFVRIFQYSSKIFLLVILSWRLEFVLYSKRTLMVLLWCLWAVGSFWGNHSWFPFWSYVLDSLALPPPQLQNQQGRLKQFRAWCDSMDALLLLTLKNCCVSHLGLWGVSVVMSFSNFLDISLLGEFDT